MGGTIGGQPLAAAPSGDQGGLSGALVAAWAGTTRAFARHADSVAAGREVALAATLLTAVLVWILARQLGLTRWLAGAAVLLTGLSPLSVTLHREVVPGVLAAPFLVGAFVLASGAAASEGRARMRAAAAAACLTAGAFTAPLALAWVPALVWVLWVRAEPEERSSVLSGAALGSGTLIAAWWICGSVAHWLPGWLSLHALWHAAFGPSGWWPGPRAGPQARPGASGSRRGHRAAGARGRQACGRSPQGAGWRCPGAWRSAAPARSR
jgi:hypothetical protein